MKFHPIVAGDSPSTSVGGSDHSPLVDAESGEELVVVAPRYASMSANRRRYHLPDSSTRPAIEPLCSVARQVTDEWQYRRRSTANSQGVCCQYCSGDVSRKEISAKGGSSMGTIAQTLEEMSVDEFDSRSGADL